MLTNFQTNFKPQFLQFFSQFSQYFVPHSISCAIFSSKLYSKLLSKLEIQKTSNFITSHLLVNSNIWEKTHKINTTCAVSKLIKFLKLEQKLIKFTLSFSSLASVFHQEYWGILQKFYKFHSFTAPTFFQKFYKFYHSHNTIFTKKVFANHEKQNFEKCFKFLTRAPKKGHAGIVRGTGPPVKIQAFLLLLRCIFWAEHIRNIKQKTKGEKVRSC